MVFLTCCLPTLLRFAGRATRRLLPASCVHYTTGLLLPPFPLRLHARVPQRHLTRLTRAAHYRTCPLRATTLPAFLPHLHRLRYTAHAHDLFYAFSARAPARSLRFATLQFLYVACVLPVPRIRRRSALPRAACLRHLRCSPQFAFRTSPFGQVGRRPPVNTHARRQQAIA